MRLLFWRKHKAAETTSVQEPHPKPPTPMDVYPPEFISHEAPLLIVSGLGSPDKYSEIPPYPLLESGPLVSSELPPVTTEPAPQLLDCFLRSDATGIWAGRPERGVKGTPPVFRIRAVGRV
jgi:hypothetical protein